MMSRISISLDDVKGIFKVLQSGNVKSIFETRTLGFLREMHERYGCCFEMYCSYKAGDYCMDNLGNKFSLEFQENAAWLKWGFHCYDEEDVYGEKSGQSLEEILNIFSDCLEKCTAQKNFTNTLRIHRFEGRKEQCEFLWKKGVKYLFTSDDNRDNYYLDDSERKILEKEKILFDVTSGLTFIKSCIRLENINDFGDLEKDIKDRAELEHEIIPIFTHEWKMDDENVRRLFEQCCRLESELR